LLLLDLLPVIKEVWNNIILQSSSDVLRLGGGDTDE
jgi:hypothetical protein